MSGNLMPDPYVPNLFNAADYYHSSGSITLEQADDRYLLLTGGSLSGLLFCKNSLAVSGNLILNGGIVYTTATELNYLNGTIPGTASASNAIILDASRNITNMNNITSTGILTMSNTNDSILISNSSTSGRSNVKFVNDSGDYLESGIRSSGAANPRTHYWYSNGSYKLLMSLSSGDISIQSSTQSSSYSTGALQVNGGLAVSKLVYCDSVKINSSTNSTSTSTGSITTLGGIGCSKDIKCGGNITLSSFGYLDQVSALFLAGDSSSSGLLTYRTSDRSCYMQSGSLASVYGYYNYNQNGLFINRSNFNPIGSCNSNSLLDFGTESHAFQVNLYGGSYGITAADNALQLLSGGTNGIYFGRGSGYTASSYDMQLTQNGSLTVGSSIRASGFNTAGFSGAGLELHYSSYGQIYAYNRSTLLFRGLYLGNEVYLSGGNTSIGIGAVASSWRLEVGTNNQNVSSYGYLNSGGGVGTSGSSGSVAFSAYFQGRIAVQGEVDVLSDCRVKEGVRDISEDEATRFITRCMPKHYCFKNESNNELQYGYLAQDVAKAGLDTLVVCREEKGLQELIDEDGFVSPKDTVFTVAYQKIPALLHKYILMQDKRLDEQAKEIQELKDQLALLLSRPVVLNPVAKQKNKE